MLSLLFLALHNSRIMELLVMMVVAVIIFQEIFGCADRQKLSSTRMSEKAIDAQGKKGKGKEGEAQGKKSKNKEKEKEKEKKSKEEGTQQTVAQTAMAPSQQQPSATQISFHGKEQEAKKPEEKKEKPEPAPAPEVPVKVRKHEKPLLSDPIVTPVTDEFPTDEQNEKEEGKDKAQQTGQTGRRFKPGKDLSVDYGAKKHKTGAERCVSDPIVTPVTDEFATEDEGTEAKDNAKKTDGKKENGKEGNGKEKKKSDGKKG